MRKELSELSLEELWQLFPIFLTEHKDEWNAWYEDEKNILTPLIPQDKLIRVSHIGSTAINDIWAKPIVDILIELNGDLREIRDILCSNGYICMSEEESRISLNKGYTKYGFAEKVFHIHLRYAGDNNELYFRDYMNDNPSLAKEYERLKLGLWKKYEHDRAAYTDSKTDFITVNTERARKLYGEKY